MVFSYYLWKIPYSIIWEIKNFFKKTDDIVFYCADELDWIVFRNVYKHLNNVNVVSKNRKVQLDLKKLGIKSSLMPSFPKTVIMARHALHKFPYKKIRRIGMRHGPYHFKKMISKNKYNAFDIFFFTSSKELEIAEKLGITSGAIGGFPKLDDAFNDSIHNSYLEELRKEIGINPNKPVIVFTATWDKSGMSAIHKWVNKIDSLSDDYNILVTLHPFIRDNSEFKECYFINDKNILPYLKLSDIIIGDTSSILAEACALNKLIITFKVDNAKRLSDEIKRLISEISIQINDFSELKSTISNLLLNPNSLRRSQEKWNAIMFDKLDGKASERIVEAIMKHLTNRSQDLKRN